MSLAGCRVVLPRPDPADPFVRAVAGAGADVVPTALTRTVETGPADLDTALCALARGAHSWLAVTSATTVTVLAGRARHLGTTLADVVGTARVAAVGPATADALREAGVPVALTPPGPEHSAASLVAAWPPASRRELVLVPRSALAAPTLVTGLRERGWVVDDVVAYTTMPVDRPDPVVGAALGAPGRRAVALTSGSTARALVELYGRPAPEVRICTLGRPTAAVAAELGLPVHAVAAEQTPAGLLAALTSALRQEHR